MSQNIIERQEKFVKSVPTAEDFTADSNKVTCAIRDIYAIYRKFVYNKGKHEYKYIHILVGYLLFIASKYMYKYKSSQKPSLIQVSELTCETFLNPGKEMYTYPDSPILAETVVRNLVDRYLDDEIWTQFVSLIDIYETNVFAGVVLSQTVLTNEHVYSFTPAALTKLALQILDIKNFDQVMDFGCGIANFMVEMFKNNKLVRYAEDGYSKYFPGGKYYGYEIATEEYEVAVLRANLLGAHYLGRDVFNIDDECKKLLCDTNIFNKIFADYPRGLKSFSKDGFDKKMSPEWIFSDWICKHLDSEGKAVAIMSNSAAWSTLDIKTRKEFIDNGLIEAVISLPEGLFSYTNIAATMVVFSHNNKTIKMVDATKCVTFDKPSNTLTDDNINKILQGLYNDTDYSKTVSKTELQNNDYVLNYGRYVVSDIKFKNGKKFGDVIVSVRRGVVYNSRDLAPQKGDDTTDIQYLSLSNIKNGIVDDNLPYLLVGAEKVENTNMFLKKDDLIISKSGQPYKIAVVSPHQGQRIIPSVNMYVIELDKKQVNPYYVKAFFESQRGKALLNSRSNHATIVNISRDELQKIKIPVPSLKIQEKIATAYLARADEYKVYQTKLENVVSRLNSVFDDNYED